MDVAIESLLSQQLYGLDQPFHRVVRTLHNTGAQKQPFNVIAPVKISGQRHDFSRCKGRPGDIIAAATDTVGTIVNAEIGVKDFQQRYAATVFGIRMADSGGRGISELTPTVAPAAAA